MLVQDNADNDGSESADLPIWMTFSFASQPRLGAVAPLERYVWLAPYVMECEGAVGSKNGTIRAQCPAHRDVEQSLVLRPQYGISCEAGCTYEAMLKALDVHGGPRAVQLSAI
jgi:hypothetical protein